MNDGFVQFELALSDLMKFPVSSARDILIKNAFFSFGTSYEFDY